MVISRRQLFQKFDLLLFLKVNETTSSGSSAGDALARRCFAVLKNALQPDCWPGIF